MPDIASGEIIGGLGNQLFIIALLIAYTKRTKKKLVFKYEESLYNNFNLPRKTFWHTLFKDQFKVLPPEEYSRIPFRYVLNEQTPYCYRELPAVADNVLLKGYYQSWKYIDDDTRKQMINHIYSNEELMYKAYDLYNQIKAFFGSDTQDDDMVSVHVRRTDYILSKDYHFNLQKDYYQKALTIANKKKIVVFSDDIQWCKANIDKSWYDYDNIYFVDSGIVELEFILMSLFQHNIIANSTYSLWASFISTYQNPKIIIAPKMWNAHQASQHWDEIYHKYITHII